MPYFRTCPHCGAHLDPGEICDDCRMETEKDAHQPTKHCERLYHQRTPKRTVSPILHSKGFSVKRSDKL